MIIYLGEITLVHVRGEWGASIYNKPGLGEYCRGEECMDVLGPLGEEAGEFLGDCVLKETLNLFVPMLLPFRESALSASVILTNLTNPYPLLSPVFLSVITFRLR